MKGRYIPLHRSVGELPACRRRETQLKKMIETRLACVCLVLALCSYSRTIVRQLYHHYCGGLRLPGFSEDGGPALDSGLHYPVGITLGNSGNMFIADGGNYRVRKALLDEAKRSTCKTDCGRPSVNWYIKILIPL